MTKHLRPGNLITLVSPTDPTARVSGRFKYQMVDKWVLFPVRGDGYGGDRFYTKKRWALDSHSPPKPEHGQFGWVTLNETSGGRVYGFILAVNEIDTEVMESVDGFHWGYSSHIRSYPTKQVTYFVGPTSKGHMWVTLSDPDKRDILATWEPDLKK